MNADATRGVSADLSIGAELDSVIWIGIGLLAAGALLAAGLRSRSRPECAAAAEPSDR